jgi:hypothetical protein
MVDGWVVMRTRVYIEAGMGWFTVNFMAKRATRSPVNIYVKRGNVAICFRLHCGLKCSDRRCTGGQEVPQPVGSVRLDDQSVIHAIEPAEELMSSPVDSHLLEVLHEEVGDGAITGRNVKLIDTPSNCS